MVIESFLKGTVLGFSIAAPVGPIGLLCIRRSLANGWRAGLSCGVGAALADFVYGCAAAVGLRVALDGVAWVRYLGVAFLMYLAWSTAVAKPGDRVMAVASVSKWRLMAETFLLTISNPMTILSFAAMFAGLGAGLSAPMIALGVFCGSLIWWLMLSGMAARLGRKLDAGGMVWVNRASGGVIGLMAVWSLLG